MRTLREVVVTQTSARVTFRNVSQYSVELVWFRAVACHSARKLVLRAGEQYATLEIL